jgi:hypothetical protein
MISTICPRHLFTCIAALSLAACTSDYQVINPPPTPPGARVQLTNLVENVPASGVAADTNLINPWGLALSSTGALWVADNHTGLATVYDGWWWRGCRRRVELCDELLQDAAIGRNRGLLALREQCANRVRADRLAREDARPAA